MRILVTGGAGFIGSHLVTRLIEAGHTVRILDACIPQVHGRSAPAIAPRDGTAELIVGDVRSKRAVASALNGIDAVYHLAAEVGVGQSMYEIVRYVDANTTGQAVLLEELVARRGQIRRLVVASSMSIYGEGSYECTECGPVVPALRSRAQLARRQWELTCPSCARDLLPRPTDEAKPLSPSSVYAITKQDHEQLSLVVGRAYDIPTVALRFFNVYGRGQALSNPYTGAAAIFSSRLLNGQPPILFEDALQTRDFVHVSDIVKALLLALDAPAAIDHAINVGSGVPTTIRDLARYLTRGLGLEIEPSIVGRYREGDVRHCYADIRRAGDLLGYSPTVRLEDGLAELVTWVRDQTAFDTVEHATDELETRGLVR